MPAILALLAEVLALLSATTGYVSNILGIVGTAAQEHQKYAIETIAAQAANTVNSPTWGNHALLDAMAAFRAEAESNSLAIITAISALPQTGDPVTLPTLPPAVIDGDTLLAIADAVWNDPQLALPTTPADALKQTARALNVTQDIDYYRDMGIFKVARVAFNTSDIYVHTVSYPTFDPGDILTGETLLDCLTRQNPIPTCSYPWSPQTFVGIEYAPPDEVIWITTIDEAEFQRRYNPSAGVLGPLQAPIWPGFAGVALGSPTALAAALTVTEDMHGVLIQLDSVPPDKPRYVIGSSTATAHIGQIAFQSDNGDMEYPQNLSFTNEVYLPKDMAMAAAVKIRCVPGVSGTVTPFTILP